MKFGVGQPVPRTEDPRFLTGRGRYVADLAPSHVAYGYVVRSPHAHASIKSIETMQAKAAAGVLAVLTGADVKAAGLGALPCDVPPIAFGGPPRVFMALHPILAADRVRHVGDPVAFIVAESLYQARDAAELVKVDYEPLPAATATDQATSPGAALVWDEAPKNIWFAMERGDQAATEAAFKAAAQVVSLRLVNNRLSANSMETRSCLAEHDRGSGRSTLYTSSQMPHKLRANLATIFHTPETKFRVVCPDVGGGFGMKGGVYPEDALVVFAARKLNRPVQWVAERSEGIASDTHGRDCVSEAALALDAGGKFLGLRVVTDYAQGAYLSAAAAVPAALGSMAYPNVYDLPAAHVSLRAVFTHTTPTGPYRGAGKPEAVYVIERLVDAAAAALDIDPSELRRRNYIKPAAVPYTTPFMLIHDSAGFEAVMDKAMHFADWTGFAKRRADSRKTGKLRGRGMAYFMEIAASPFNDRMEIRFDENGTVTVLSGTHSHGQGHETVYAQMVADWLGIDFASIRVMQGDTDQVAFGRGTFGSRSMTIGGSALKNAADVLIEKGRKMAGHVLEASASDIVFAQDKFSVAGTDKSIGLVELAKRSFAPVGWPAEFGLGLEAVGTFTPARPNLPNGCYICEVEIDPDTGAVAIVRFTAVDDCGLIINPLLFEGQIHGGIAMGIGQALMEKIEFDHTSGQLMSGSFLDYSMPRAEHMPSFRLEELNDGCKSNPLGVKGAGESGTVGAPPAIINAIVDALKDYGVTDIEMPATPSRVWQAMRAGTEAAAAG